MYGEPFASSTFPRGTQGITARLPYTHIKQRVPGTVGENEKSRLSCGYIPRVRVMGHGLGLDLERLRRAGKPPVAGVWAVNGGWDANKAREREEGRRLI